MDERYRGSFFFSTIMLPMALLLGASSFMVFGMCNYTYFLFAILAAYILVEFILTIIAGEKQEAERFICRAMMVVGIVGAIIIVALQLWGVAMYNRAVETFERDVDEITEHPIAAMGEDTTFSGTVFCFGTKDYYVVMEETDTGGYLRTKYPSAYTVLYKSDAEPMAKRTYTYREQVRLVKDKLFLRYDETMGENVTWRSLEDTTYEIYIPYGTLQQMPSMNVPLD